jgi:hypothetical protein
MKVIKVLATATFSALSARQFISSGARSDEGRLD